MRIRLPKSTDFVSEAKRFRKFLKKKTLPEYFLLKRYLSEEILHSRMDNPRDLAIVVSFLLGTSVKGICDVFGLTYEEFVSLHFPRCLRAKLAVFSELVMALFVSAVVDRDVNAIKTLLEHIIGNLADFRTLGIQQLLNFVGEEAWSEESIKESKLYKKYNDLLAEKQNVLADLIFDYERTLAEILEKQGIYSDVESKVEEIIAELEERYLSRLVFDKTDNAV